MKSQIRYMFFLTNSCIFVLFSWCFWLSFWCSFFCVFFGHSFFCVFFQSFFFLSWDIYPGWALEVSWDIYPDGLLKFLETSTLDLGSWKFLETIDIRILQFLETIDIRILQFLKTYLLFDVLSLEMSRMVKNNNRF